MLCRWQRGVLAIVLLSFLAPPAVPSAAQSSSGALVIHTDTEMLGAPTLRGGGHIAWTLTGDEAVALRRRVLAMFDEYPAIPPGFAWGGTTTPGNGDGVLSGAETKAFTDLLEAEIEGQRQALGGTPWRYLRIERTDLAERDLAIDRSVDGLVGRGANSMDPVEIRFIYEGRTLAENYASPLAPRVLADGLYAVFGMRQAQALDGIPPRVWPLQVMGGWHTVRLPGDGRVAFWAGNTAGDADPVNGSYDNNASNITVTATAPGSPWVDLRFATEATASFRYMGRVSDPGDALRVQVAVGPSFATWVDMQDEFGRTALPDTADYDWQLGRYNLTAYVGQLVQLRLAFASNGTGNAAPGFFVRDFTVDAPAPYTGDLVVSDIDYMVGTLDFQDAAAPPGRLHLLRTPAGEVLIYNAGFSAGAPPGDGVTFRAFLWYENPQILFVVLIIAGYVISRYQNRAYRSYRAAHPREYRATANPTRWLHWLGRGAIIALALLYVFPTGLGVLGIGVIVSGTALLAVAAGMASVVCATTWAMYRRQARLIPPESEAASNEGPILEPPPPEAGSAVEVERHCSHCLGAITDRGDVVACACGESYHRGCADVLQACATCGRSLGEKPPQKVTATCGACGEVQLIDAGAEALRTRCSSCSATLQMPEKGYNYLVLTADAAPVYDWFRRLCNDGAKGLAMSTSFPDKLRRDYGLENADLLWLSDTNPGPTTFDPRRLEFEIMRVLMLFMRTNPGGSLMIDGVEHLVVENTLDRVVRFAKRLNDLASVSRITVFVPVAPGSIGAEDLTLLQQAFDRTIDLTA